MVELRVINGGKRNEEEHRCFALQLFSASTVVDNFCGRDRVKFNWIYIERERPVASYDKLICGYKCIDKRVRPYFEQHIRELFTKEEVEALKTYLTKTHPMHAASFEVCEEALPASDAFIPMPFSGIPATRGRGYFLPFETDEGYDLPFKAAAFYDLKNCPASKIIPQASREKGVAFLTQALKDLGLEGRVDAARLEATVEAIYAGQGLYVERESNRACDCEAEKV